MAASQCLFSVASDIRQHAYVEKLSRNQVGGGDHPYRARSNRLIQRCRAVVPEHERKDRLESLMIRAQAGVLSRADLGTGALLQAPIRDSTEIMWPANHTRSPAFNAVDRAIATNQTNQLDR